MAVEDLTAYTKVDPGSKFTVASNTITYNNLGHGDEAYVYDDKGVNHFDGDYEHLLDIDMSPSSTDGSVVFPWLLANELGSWNTIFTGGYDMNTLQLYKSSDNIRFGLGEMSGSFFWDFYIDVVDTEYYLKFVRDESIGVHGTLYCYIYDDALRTNLVNTLSLALHEKADFKYIYGICASGSGGTIRNMWGTVSNLNLDPSIGNDSSAFFFFRGGSHE